MTKPKPKLHPVEWPFTPRPYRLHECVTFRICPTRDSSLQTFVGTITCLPEQSPFDCYHVETREGETWFIIESEITGKVGEEQAA